MRNVIVQAKHQFDLYGPDAAWVATVYFDSLPGKTWAEIEQNVIEAFAAWLRSTGAAPMNIAGVEHVSAVFSSLEAVAA